MDEDSPDTRADFISRLLEISSTLSGPSFDILQHQVRKVAQNPSLIPFCGPTIKKHFRTPADLKSFGLSDFEIFCTGLALYPYLKDFTKAHYHQYKPDLEKFDSTNLAFVKPGIIAIEPEFWKKLENSKKMEHSLDNLVISLAEKPGALDSSSLASAITKHHVKITEHAISSLIALLSVNPQYPSDIIGKGLQKYSETTDWDKVFLLIRSPEYSKALSFSNPESLLSIVKFTDSYSDRARKAIISALFTPGFYDVSSQVDLLTSALVLSEKINWYSLGLPAVLDKQTAGSLPENLSHMVLAYPHQNINHIAFIELCLDAVCREDQSATKAKSFLDEHANNSMELFLIAGSHFAEPWPPLFERLLNNFFDLVIRRGAYAPLALNALSKSNPAYLERALADLYSREAQLQQRILSCCLESHIVDLIAKSKGFGFALEVFAAADKEKISKFEDYIQATEKNYGAEFIRVLLDFLELKASLEYSNNQAGSATAPFQNGLNLRSVAAALALITSVDIPQDRIEQFKSIQIQCLQAYPRLINFGQGHDTAILARGDSNTFSPDVEREMKIYYQKMYEQQIEIREIITMLQKLKESDDGHDQDVFACMVHSLFDEYRFFPEYPLNALATTAVLFGSLVYFHLIDGMPLSIALRFILESLRMPTDSNMFRFGLQALFEFRQRLYEFPKYCAILLEIPGLATQQQFYQQIKDTVAGKRPDADTEHHVPVYKSISADVRVDESPQEEPTEAVSDKVLFLVNNLAANNVSSKAKELASILEKKYHRWFASYIVRERSMREPNYHTLYISMLQEIRDHNLEQYCLKITYQLIIQFLDSPDTISSTDKRGYLKNLGQWLGCLLLSRDKPILFKNIAFKKLLVEADELNQLPVVIPFVCKVLEKASSSHVFLPPNPWLLGIMRVLSELYQYSDLKLNLKFEIEVLCNQFNTKIGDIEASDIIRNHGTQEELDSQNNSLTMEMQQMRLQDARNNERKEAVPATVPANPPAAIVPRQDTNMVPNLIAQLQLVGTTPFVTHPGFKKIFLLAVEQSLREILQPVVERSVTIASITTKELLSKDFALEPDEQKMRLAAQNMVRALAASISTVTCKDPLRESLATHLRQLMVTNGYADHESLSEQITMAVNDNVDAVCSIVEKSAIAKSLPEIEAALSTAYLLRKAHRESRSGQPFVDPHLSSRYPLQLPDPFRLKAGGLSPQQFSIYENFGNFNAVDNLTNEEPAAAIVEAQRPVGLAPTDQLDRRGMVPQAHIDQAIMQMQNGMDTLEKLINESKETSLAQLTSEHPISALLTQILSVASRSLLKDQVVLKTSQMAVSALFTLTDSQLGREVFCFLLDKLCELSATTAKEVVLWLIYSDDERKYNVPVMVTLIKAKLITASEIDVNLAKQVSAKVETAINFAAGLIFEAVLGNTPCALRTEFTGCLAAMEVLAKGDPPNTVAQNLLKAMEIMTAGSWSISGNAPNVKDQLSYIFAEWVRLTQHPSRTERSFHIFVYQLSKHNILSNGDLLGIFIRTGLKLSVDSYRKGVALPSQVAGGELFIATDALAKLIATILATSSKMSTKARLEYTKSIFSVVSLILAADHDLDDGEEFSEQVYFRLFSTFLYEIVQVKLPTDFMNKLYILLADVFANLQPQAFPGFAYAWETLISHRLFLPKIMDVPGKKGWEHISNLLCQFLSFQGRYISGTIFPPTITTMYKGTLRIFLVILHDYPEFLVEYHYALCNALPPSFVQLRNLVLSAFPATIQLPDPLSTSLKFDDIPEVKSTPDLATDPASELQLFGIKKAVENYIKSPSDAGISAIITLLKAPSENPAAGIGFSQVCVNIQAINALVLYIGVMAAASAAPDKTASAASGSKDEKGIFSSFDSSNEYYSLLVQLFSQGSAELRYFVAEAIANNLRYPNKHTLFFSCAILSIFGAFGQKSLGDDKLDITHIITRVLLERIICNRPHPVSIQSEQVDFIIETHS